MMILKNIFFQLKWGEGQTKGEIDVPHYHVGDERSGPENHVKRHRDIEIERVVVANAANEEHRHQDKVVFDANLGFDAPELCGENEPVECNEEKLRKRD